MLMAAASTTSFRAKKRARIQCPQITTYLRLVETGRVRSCERQKKLCAYVRKVFAEEELIIDTDRINAYGKFQAYFPFDLFPWEWFVLVLFLCVFKKDGEPRWDELYCIVGRGAGKNGFIAFIAFCLITAANGILDYNVNICANSEEQAKTSFEDVRRILNADRERFRKSFEWSKTEISSKSTGSIIKYLTSGASSKDGGRPGLVVFDEVHEFVKWKLVEVLTTGLGKVDHSRMAIISSNGDIRDGVLDAVIETCDSILNGEEDDNGILPFVCTLDAAEEVHDERNWEKANPSIRYLPVRFMNKIRKEYRKWLKNPAGGNASLMTRRMGIPQGDIEHEITSRENLMRASRDVPDLRGKPCVLGLDVARKDDMCSAALLFRDGDEYQVIHHSWFCSNSRDKSRINAPLEEWESLGILTIVNDVEIHTSLVMDWIYAASKEYDIIKVAMDDYRYDIVHEELKELGFDANDGTVFKVRPSDHARVQPIINSAFLTGNIAWGNDPAMRWFTNNTKIIPWMNGNFKFEKIEPRGRKTDGFFALVAAFRIKDDIPECIYDEPMMPIVW